MLTHVRVRGRSLYWRPAITLGAVLALTLSGPIRAQTAQQEPPAAALGSRPVGGQGSANYQLAARWAPYKLSNLLHSTSVQPHWIKGGQRFWYQWETTQGTFYYIVDPTRASQRQIFDNARVAAELTRITKDPWDAQHLPIRAIRFVDSHTLQFDVQSSQDEEKGDSSEVERGRQQQQRGGRNGRQRAKKKMFHFEYDVDTRTLRQLEDYEAPDNHPSWASVSPDGKTVVFARDHNLFMMTGEAYQKILDARRDKTGEEADSLDQNVKVDEVQLTDDGVQDYGYDMGDRARTDDWKAKHAHDRKRARVSWSKDSKRFAVERSDQRKVGDLWVIHSTDNKRPELETYKYDMPGEKNVTQNEIWIYDLASRKKVKVDDNPWKDQDMSVVPDRQFVYPDLHEPRTSVWLSDNSNDLYFLRLSRDRHRAALMEADAATGKAHTVILDSLNIYIETRRPERLPNGDLLWWSERDGWAHLYRYGADGTLKNQITSGPWHVESIEGVDAKNGVIYFTANDHEQGEDPYYQHLYRVNVDGSGLQLLDPGDFDHRVSIDESNRYFVDNYSRVNTVPAAVLRDATGKEVTKLQTADFSQIEAAGWKMPERFKVKAADGITDLYGVMYKPFDFDPTKKYPIIEYVYPGPQTEAVAKSFSTSSTEMSLAQFGFIVVSVGNRGGHPARSKWYHSYGYGNLRDYGLADKKVTVEQLAERYPWIDANRVGIYGHSGGGFMSTAAMLVYPDLFKVAVSESGNHTNDIYNRWWSETHHGVKEVVGDSGKISFEYSIATNPEIAKNLKGHLMLSTGTADNNVHPSNTYRMAKALIEANKRFDFFILPDARHGYGSMNNYWFWIRSEYFVRWLLHDETHFGADILQMQVEQAKTR